MQYKYFTSPSWYLSERLTGLNRTRKPQTRYSCTALVAAWLPGTSVDCEIPWPNHKYILRYWYSCTVDTRPTVVWWYVHAHTMHYECHLCTALYICTYNIYFVRAPCTHIYIYVVFIYTLAPPLRHSTYMQIPKGVQLYQMDTVLFP